MRVARTFSHFIVGSSLLAFSVTAANALSVTFGGGPVTNPPFPGYGTSIEKNNVVNNPQSGGSVTDPTVAPGNSGGGTMVGSVFDPPLSSTVKPAIAQVSLGSAASYSVDWFFIGAESGFNISLQVPGVASNFLENNQNSQYAGSSQIGPQYIGTSSGLTNATIPFTLIADGGSNGTLANGASNNVPGLPPTANNKAASIVFSYAQLDEGNVNDPTDNTVARKWTLTLNPVLTTLDGLDSIWFLFAFNDTGGPDDNHDDFVGMARVYALTPPDTGNNVPIPGAFALMGTVLAGAGGVFGWRRRRGRAAA